MPCDNTSSLPSRPPSSPYPPPLLPAPETHTPTKRKTGSARGRSATSASPFIPKTHGRTAAAARGIPGGPEFPPRTRRTAQSLCHELANRPYPTSAPPVNGLRGKDYSLSDITSPDGKKVLSKTLRPDPECKTGVKRFESLMTINAPKTTPKRA